MSRGVHFLTLAHRLALRCKFCKTAACAKAPTLAFMHPESSAPDPAAVRRAVQMAVHLPSGEAKRLRVQVLDRHGHLLASAMLQGADQAAFLKDMLQNVGAFDMVPPPLAAGRGCDVLLQEAYQTRPAEQPRDLVRSATGNHWAVRGSWRGDFSAPGRPTITA